MAIFWQTKTALKLKSLKDPNTGLKQLTRERKQNKALDSREKERARKR